MNDDELWEQRAESYAASAQQADPSSGQAKLDELISRRAVHITEHHWRSRGKVRTYVVLADEDTLHHFHLTHHPPKSVGLELPEGVSLPPPAVPTIEYLGATEASAQHTTTGE